MIYPGPQLLLDANQHAFNIFHVEYAPGDEAIRTQQDFMLRYGI